jgi:C-terminal processing protease CtpA/Prc
LPEGFGWLEVDVVDEDGWSDERARVVPVDCEGLGGGPPAIYGVPAGPCTVRAVRKDGALLAHSSPVTAEVRPDDVAYLLLELPRARTGGVGVRFMPDVDGMRVVQVVPDSPAEEAGLAAGDLVIEVDGHATAGMQTADFVDLMTGAEGSDVTFTVGWSGDTGLVEETLTLARRFLDG